MAVSPTIYFLVQNNRILVFVNQKVACSNCYEYPVKCDDRNGCVSIKDHPVIDQLIKCGTIIEKIQPLDIKYAIVVIIQQISYGSNEGILQYSLNNMENDLDCFIQLV
ncbi:hypothetical protein ACTA71_005815 [Dictyostelium dimigraforme]